MYKRQTMLICDHENDLSYKVLLYLSLSVYVWEMDKKAELMQKQCNRIKISGFACM